jgi:hypothetical protein
MITTDTVQKVMLLAIHCVVVNCLLPEVFGPTDRVFVRTQSLFTIDDVFYDVHFSL